MCDVKPLEASTGWLQWTREMKFFLLGEHLWDMAADAPTESAQAYAAIDRNVGFHYKGLVGMHTTATAAWAALKEQHTKDAPANRLLLLEQFGKLQKEPGESIEAYIGRASNLVDELKCVEVELADALVASQILKGLPPAYKLAVTCLQLAGIVKLPELTLKLRLIEPKALEAGAGATERPACFARTAGDRHQRAGAQRNPPASGSEHSGSEHRGSRGNGAGGSAGRGGKQRSTIAVVSTAATSPGVPEHLWCLHSGAPEHMSPYIDRMHNVWQLDVPVTVQYGGANSAHIATHAGSMRLYSPSLRGYVMIKRVLHMPGVPQVMSVPQLTAAGATVQFQHPRGCVYNSRQQLVFMAPRADDGGTYQVDAGPPSAHAMSARVQAPTAA